MDTSHGFMRCLNGRAHALFNTIAGQTGQLQLLRGMSVTLPTVHHSLYGVETIGFAHGHSNDCRRS